MVRAVERRTRTMQTMSCKTSRLRYRRQIWASGRVRQGEGMSARVEVSEISRGGGGDIKDVMGAVVRAMALKRWCMRRALIRSSRAHERHGQFVSKVDGTSAGEGVWECERRKAGVVTVAPVVGTVLSMVARLGQEQVERPSGGGRRRVTCSSGVVSP